MPVLQALYAANPAAVWLACAALLVTLELATGWARVAPAALAALAPAALAAAQASPGLPLELGLFVLLSAGLLAAARFAPPRAVAVARPRAAQGLPAPRKARPERAAPRRRAARPALLNLEDGDAAAPQAAAAPAPARPSPGPVVTVVASAPARRPAPAATVAFPADPNRAKRLVGATGRTAGEFANGVGRVWLDGSEWGAELDHGDELEPDRPVEVVRVSGGIRLTVRPLPVAA